MLLQFLKLVGFDVEAKVAAAKAQLEQTARQATEHLTNTARQYALVAGCFAAAALTALFAMIVGLTALYQWAALNHGPFVGFGIVGGLLVLLTVGLAITGSVVVRSAPNAQAEEAEAVSALAPPATIAPLETKSSLDGAAAERASEVNTDDVYEPLFALVGQVKIPVTGNPEVDNVLGAVAQRVANEALVRGARLVQTGGRGTMLTILGSAALLGWLMVRVGERQELSVASPTEV